MSETYPLDVVPDRPEFDIKIDGELLEPIVRSDVMEIDVHTEVAHHGRASLLVQNWNPDGQETRHSDDPPFALGRDVEILLGYHSERTSVFAGTVTGMRTHFPLDGAPTVEVMCRTKSALLDGARRSRVVEDSTDSDLAEIIASDYGLTADVGAGFEQPAIVVADVTDWGYLVRRAGELGWVTFVRGDELVFRPPSTADEAVELTWGRNLMELELTQDLNRRIDTAGATGWSSDELDIIESEATPSDAEYDAAGRSTADDALGDAGWPLRTETRPRSLELVTAELDRSTVGTVSTNEQRHFAGRGRSIGLPQIAIDTWLQVSGVGERVGGAHYVSGVRHRLGQLGFHTEFQLGAPERLTPPAAPAAQGLSIGIVEDLDDPKAWGRVKVKFPWQVDAPDAVWARLSVFDAGNEHGAYFVPDVGQEVVVGFLGDDRRFAVVIGSLWNGQQAPPESMDAAANNIRAFVSRAGHRLTFDDGDEALIRLESAAGHVIVLNDSDESITLTEQGGSNGITINGDGITIEAGSGDINITAASGSVAIDTSDFSATATSGAKVESSATLDLTASATLGISGALVNIN